MKRVIIAGGDKPCAWGVDALTVRMQLPASPLCVAPFQHRGGDGLEVALKGGQVGTDRCFSSIRDGLGG